MRVVKGIMFVVLAPRVADASAFLFRVCTDRASSSKPTGFAFARMHARLFIHFYLNNIVRVDRDLITSPKLCTLFFFLE